MEGMASSGCPRRSHLPTQQSWVGLRSSGSGCIPNNFGEEHSDAKGLKTVLASSMIAGPSVYPQAFRYGPCLFPSGSQAAGEASTGEPAWSHVHMKQLGPSIGPPCHPLVPQTLIKSFFTHRGAALLRGLSRGAAPSTRALLLLVKMGLDCGRHQAAYPSLPSLLA